jgi:hypothetical protein
MTRMEALEAVAEAAEHYREARMNDDPEMAVTSKRSQMYAALDALPADPAPAQEVEVAVWEGMTGLIEYVKAGSIRDQQEIFGPLWTRLGTVRLPLVKETGQ